MNKLFELLRTKVMLFFRAVRTLVLSAFARSDVGRWGGTESLNPSWDTRTKMIASLIPEGSSVLEFGAGRMALKKYLPASCRYTPSDITDRGVGTIVCDLNAQTLPAFAYNDIVVFGGVLEYVFDLNKLISHLVASSGTIIASYAVTDFSNQQSALQRRKHGWVNDLSNAEILEVFSRHGFVCGQALAWENQFIYQFVKSK
jgi:hypothetical protein